MEIVVGENVCTLLSSSSVYLPENGDKLENNENIDRYVLICFSIRNLHNYVDSNHGSHN